MGRCHTVPGRIVTELPLIECYTRVVLSIRRSNPAKVEAGDALGGPEALVPRGIGGNLRSEAIEKIFKVAAVARTVDQLRNDKHIAAVGRLIDRMDGENVYPGDQRLARQGEVFEF